MPEQPQGLPRWIVFRCDPFKHPPQKRPQPQLLQQACYNRRTSSSHTEVVKRLHDQLTHLRAPDSQHPIYDPRAAPVRFFSAILGVEKCYYVYLPPEYADTTRRFPVLYLLRGHEREWINPDEDSSRAGRTIIDIYEQLHTAGRVGPLLLVMPSMASDDNHISGLMTNFRAPELAEAKPGIGSGRFESYFVEEVIPHIDRNYRTIPSRRAIAGFSLGGAMAVKIAARRPELFTSVSAYDGSFLFAADGGRTVRFSDSLLSNQMFDPHFGIPRDFDHITANSAATLIAHADSVQLRRLVWCIQYGPEHSEPWGSNFYRGEHLMRLLRSKGVTNSVQSAVLADGDHTWGTVHRHMEQVLPVHWQALQSMDGE